MATTITYAYVVPGVHTTISISQTAPERTIESVLFDGCDTATCKKPLFSEKCKKEDDAKWFCHLKDIPGYFRFVVKFDSGSALSTQFVSTNNSKALDNYNLVIENKTIKIEPIKFPVEQK